MSPLAFFLAWVADPLRVGALTPSSTALADAITAEISPACAPIIELGPGTGVFTRSLLARGIPEDRLALVECNPEFARNLEARFPAASVVGMDAARLSEVEWFGGERAGAVVSGLPLLLMPPKTVDAILEAAFACMRPDGAFYQFTYRRDCPVSGAILDRHGLTATHSGGTLANFPPARVYSIRRRAARATVLRPEWRPAAGRPERAFGTGRGELSAARIAEDIGPAGD